MHLNIYIKNRIRVGRLIELVMEVHLLCFLCGHAAVILRLDTDGCVSCFVPLHFVFACVCFILPGGYSYQSLWQNDLWVLIRE